MATISRTGIADGGTIQPAHITNIIDALDGTSTTTTVVATGSFVGTLTGTSSFATNALSSSYAVTASYALNAAGGGGGIFALTGSTYATTNNLQITGSLHVTAGVTASLQGTASFAVSSSRAVTASFTDTADQLLVQRTITEASFYPVIADSANAIATAERLKTTTNITINPGTNVIAGATLTGSVDITGSMTAQKNAVVDFSGIAIASGIGQFVIPVTQTGGTPLAGSMYWDDANAILYIYSATNAGWYNVQLNP